MRILFVNHTSVMSGAERSLLDMVEHLPPQIEASVACPPGELAGHLAARDVRWIELPAIEASLKLHPVFTPISGFAVFEAARRLRSEMRNHDLAHANSIRAGVTCVLAHGRTPIVLHVRDCLPKRRLSAWVTRWLAQRSDIVVANSAFTADCFRRTADMPGIAVEVIPGPLDTKAFSSQPTHDDPDAVRRELGLPADAPLLAIVGQITPWKGQHRAIQTLARVHRKHPEAHLLIIGSPRFTSSATRYDNVAYEESLRQLVAEHGLGRFVSFLGEREDIPRLMGSLDLLLVPSTEEPFGRVVVEGMAASRTVVATDQGGPAEVIEHGVSGYLLPPDDTNRWGATVEEMLGDSDKRADVGRRALAAAAPYSASASVKKLAQVWSTLVEDRPLRVLFLSHTGAQSGAENAMMRLLASLPIEHGRAVACPPGGKLKETVEDAGYSQFDLRGTDLSLRLRPAHTFLGLLSLVASVARLRTITRHFKPDVIHANSPRAGLIAVGARYLVGPPVLVQCHDHLPRSVVGQLARRVLDRGADEIVAVTDYTAQRFNDGLGRSPARGVHISIDQSRFHPGADSGGVYAELGLPENTPLLAQVAQITPWKGQDVAIRALHQIRREADAHLLIVGDVAFASRHYDNDGFYRSLVELVEALGLAPAVHFLGLRDDVPELMAAADVLLLPSWDEPFGTVVAEAMAVGTPVAVTDQGGLGEYVTDGRNGRLLRPHQPDVWARAIVELLAEPEALARIGRQNIIDAARFTDANYSRKMLAAYRRALDTDPRRATSR